ncbi:dioxygenase family protein [Egbenema bharatensis]|uniref:dioxygenase family protein n=1 Tax=Egbenema bharatensis TaxID=3463334 RepID=UPI003A8911B8
MVKRVVNAGLEGRIVPDRGLDHGAWEPLMLMYPEANIPVTQLSIQPHQGPTHHLQLGRALAPLRQEGVVILASGAITHNLQAFGQHELDAEPVDWAVAFDQWIAETIAPPKTSSDISHNTNLQGLINIDALLDYRHLAPYAQQNHPTEEHLLPLFVALGAAGSTPRGTQLHASFTYGVLSMAAYALE